MIECSDDCSKTSGRLWQYYWDEPFLNANDANDNKSSSFIFKAKVADQTENYGEKMLKLGYYQNI